MDLFLAIGIAVAACVLGAVVGYMYRKSHPEKKIDRTEEYARQMNADCYSKDAMGAVHYAEQIFAEKA